MTESTQLTRIPSAQLTPVTEMANQENPSLVCLAGLAPGSRHTMRQALDVIADILTAGACDHRSLPWGAMRIDLKSIRGENPDAAVGRALSFGEWMGLFSACQVDDGPVGVRDAAIIALLKIAGLRRSEVAALQLYDFDQDTRTLTVQGKRNKMRTVPMEDACVLDAISDWCYLRGDLPGALFTSICKGGTILAHGLSDQAICSMLKKRG